MCKCERCNSEEIIVETKGFEDLHNILKVFICKKCGHKKIEWVNIQEENLEYA
jgi:hypothetical protein